MSEYPPHMSAAYDKGKEIRRCRNVGCGLMRVPDAKDPAILRCPGACTMQRAKTVELTREEIQQIQKRDRDLAADRDSMVGRRMVAAE